MTEQQPLDARAVVLHEDGVTATPIERVDGVWTGREPIHVPINQPVDLTGLSLTSGEGLTLVFVVTIPPDSEVEQ